MADKKINVRKMNEVATDRRCEFCDSPIDETKSRHAKFCSDVCRHRAAQNRTTVRLDKPFSKRFKRRLMFSSPLYFS